MMKTKIYVCVLFLSFMYICKAHNTLENTFGSSAFEESKSVRQTYNGDYIFGASNLVKIDCLGAQ